MADEINRTSLKTRASLLKTMVEGQVTVDGMVHKLPEPQLDCFMMRLSIGYPDREQKIRMAAQFLSGQTPDKAEPVCRTEDILKIKEAVSNITVKESLLGYIEDIVTMT